MSKTTEHKEGKASVEVVYYTSNTLADGSHPFFVRITKNRKRKYLATGLCLHPKHWDKENKRIKNNFPNPADRRILKKALQAWEDKYQEAADELAEADEQHDARSVATRVAENRSKTRSGKLLAYCDELSSSYRATGKAGNAGIYKDLRNQLAKFIVAEYSVEDLPLERLNLSFCDKWERYLRSTGAEEITLSLRFRTLRAVLNKAIANGLAKVEHYPFARTAAERHKFSVGKFDVSTTKRAVSRDAIRLLEGLSPDTARLQLAKDVFLFSFYCGGINFVDLAQLRWHALTATDASATTFRLNYVRQKTQGKFGLKLLPPAAAIVARFRGFTHATPDSYIFPILDVVKHQTPTQVKNRLHKVLGQVNQDLKVLAPLAGIDTPLTTYVARHSFATSLKRSGVAIAIISETMGHASEETTRDYLDSFASETLDAAFEQLL
ncbi:site-specific integrase [uncultured Hymenobacter sp.]|uniref:site-specific integrase n=1 Tax=uncultured Hymenobacter sp. TaxID=170016 RepID=UPI0035C9FDAC